MCTAGSPPFSELKVIISIRPTDAYGGVPARYRVCRIRERNAIRCSHAGPAGIQGDASERHADQLCEAVRDGHAVGSGALMYSFWCKMLANPLTTGP